MTNNRANAIFIGFVSFMTIIITYKIKLVDEKVDRLLEFNYENDTSLVKKETSHIKYVNDDSIFYVKNGDTLAIMNYWAIKRLDTLETQDSCKQKKGSKDLSDKEKFVKFLEKQAKEVNENRN